MGERTKELCYGRGMETRFPAGALTTTKRIYLSGGEGFVDVFHEIDVDHYERIGKHTDFHRGTHQRDLGRLPRASGNVDRGVPATSNQGPDLWFTQFIDY